MNSISIQKHSETDLNLIEKNTAYIIGALRDGYLDEKQYLLSITQKDKEWLEYLRRMIKDTFGVESKIREFRNAFELRIFSKELFNHFRSFGVKDTSTTPEKIIHNRALWIPYISGFFDAEGYCTSSTTFNRTKKKKIPFHQNDRESLEFIKSVLEEIGIKTGNIYLQKNRNCHALYIQSMDGIRKFAVTISPVRKRKQLDDLLSVLPL